MAPIREVTRSEAIGRLRSDGAQSITLGRYHPQARIAFEEGRWTLRLLELDPELEQLRREEARAAGQRAWRPENLAACKVPGRVLISSRWKWVFLMRLRLVSWDFGAP